MAATDEEALLEVHILGCSNGKGESIVLRMPDGRWGVVDCYSPDVSDETANGTLVYLREHGVESLAFVCLTHPHDDHYRGLVQILSNYHVSAFWKFGTTSLIEIRRIVEFEWYAARLKKSEESQRSVDDLIRLFDEADRRNKRRGIDHMRFVDVVYNTRIFSQTQCDTHPIHSGIEVWGLAPCGDQTASYQRSLAANFGADRQFLAKGGVDHNKISVALWIRFGDTRIILGGDVLTAGWQVVTAEWANRLSANAVKVSHHGSESGYSEGLWEAFTQGVGTTAIVTPFKQSRLPRNEGLTHIRSHARQVWTTCGRAISNPVLPNRMKRSRWIVTKAFQATEADTDSAHSFGRCSMYFDDRGNCVRSELAGTAEDITDSI